MFHIFILFLNFLHAATTKEYIKKIFLKNSLVGCGGSLVRDDKAPWWEM